MCLNKKKTIAIKCSGSLSLGMGHIMRTMVIAEELKKTCDVFYISKSNFEYQSGVKKIKDLGFDVYYDEDDVSADFLIFDSYDVTEKMLSDLRKKYHRLMYIDDLKSLSFYDCDILLNKSLNVENLKYPVDDKCVVLLGTKYALLREEFRVAPSVTVKEKVENVFITMGGTDPKNTSVKILNILKNEPFRFNVAFSSGFSDKTKADLQRLAKENSNIVLYPNPKMADLISKSDIAITACGGTLQEIASMGLPQIGVTVASNQETNMTFGEENNLFVFGGYESEISEIAFLELFNSVVYNFDKRVKLSENEKKTVNKDGVQLIVNEILKLL